MKLHTAFDLFCGCGGLSLGLKRAGFRVLGAVDIDPLSVETYRANHRNTLVWRRDVANLSVAAVRRRLRLRPGELDLLAGCPPCQGFSSMRTLNGGRRVRDRKKNLVFEFLRFAKGLRPKALMMENVPGLASDRRMKELCRGLRRLGYDVSHRVLDAADFGVPQRRRRLILLGALGRRVDFPKPARERRTVRDAIAGLARPGGSGDPVHDLIENRSSEVRRLIRRIPADGGSLRDLEGERPLKCHRDFDGFKDVYGRMAWDRPGPTITSGCTNPSKGRFLHPEEDRAISLREAALLQSFPCDYAFSMRRGKAPAAVMIGNALPPAFGMAQAKQIARLLKNRAEE